MKIGRILVTCEFSGAVSAAFRELGHEAWSCDFLPTEGDPRWHIQGDALEAIVKRGPWDLIGIHYTCTFFANSGVQWLYLPRADGNPGRTTERDPVRWQKMKHAAVEFSQLWGAAVATGAAVWFENPTMHNWAQMELDRLIPNWQVKPTQAIQPCDFGHPETKRTGLWLHGLPPLVPSNIVRNEMALLPQKDRARVHYASPGKDRWKKRSRTLPGIAAAMADQWTRAIFPASRPPTMEVDFA